MQVRFQNKPESTDFHRGPVRVKSASIEKNFVPRNFSPRKPPRYTFLPVLKNRNPENISPFGNQQFATNLLSIQFVANIVVAHRNHIYYHISRSSYISRAIIGRDLKTYIRWYMKNMTTSQYWIYIINTCSILMVNMWDLYNYNRFMLKTLPFRLLPETF